MAKSYYRKKIGDIFRSVKNNKNFLLSNIEDCDHNLSNEMHQEGARPFLNQWTLDSRFWPPSETEDKRTLQDGGPHIAEFTIRRLNLARSFVIV